MYIYCNTSQSIITLSHLHNFPIIGPIDTYSAKVEATSVVCSHISKDHGWQCGADWYLIRLSQSFLLR